MLAFTGNSSEPVKIDMKADNSRLEKKAAAYRQKGQWLAAINALETLVKIDHKSLGYSLDLANCYMQIESFDKAVEVYSKIFVLHPNEPLLAASFGGALLRLGKLGEAETLLLHSLSLDPKNIFARINLGGVYQAQGDLKASLNNALEAVSVDPTCALAFNNLGSAFSDMAMFEQAKHAYGTAILLEPEQLDALINLGAMESRLGSSKNAIEMYERALLTLTANQTKRADAIRFFCSFEYLKEGNLEKAWDYYEGGFSSMVPLGGARSPKRIFSVPRWSGESLEGKRLLIWREQGLGDELLFGTCLHELQELNAGQIIIECDPRLVPVLARSFPNYIVRPQGYHEQTLESFYNDFDFHLPIASLMKFFRRKIEDFQRGGPYIVPNKELVNQFNQRLRLFKDKTLVGICWRSGKLSPVRNLGYTMLNDWEFLKEKKHDYVFVNLQYGDCEAELKEVEKEFEINILRWPDVDLKDDLESVFSLTACLDMVIVPGTTVSAISGALGVPTIYLSKKGWLWLGQDQLPWFTSFYELLAEGNVPVSDRLHEVGDLMDVIKLN